MSGPLPRARWLLGRCCRCCHAVENHRDNGRKTGSDEEREKSFTEEVFITKCHTNTTKCSRLKQNVHISWNRLREHDGHVAPPISRLRCVPDDFLQRPLQLTASCKQCNTCMSLQQQVENIRRSDAEHRQEERPGNSQAVNTLSGLTSCLQHQIHAFSQPVGTQTAVHGADSPTGNCCPKQRWLPRHYLIH